MLQRVENLSCRAVWAIPVPFPASAGFPSPAADELDDEIDLRDLLMPRPGSTFWFRVDGECLHDAGILDGDFVAVDKSVQAKIGHVALCLIDGDFMLKVLGHDGEGRRCLKTADREGRDRIIPFREGMSIEGVVVSVMRAGVRA